MMHERRCVMCGARAPGDGSYARARASGGPWLLVLVCLLLALFLGVAVVGAMGFLMAPMVVRRADPVPVPVPAPVAPAESDDETAARRAFDKLAVDLRVDMVKGDFAHAETLRDMKGVILRLDPKLREPLEKLEREYTEAVEAAAAEWVRKNNDDIRVLETAKKYDEAIRLMETFPKGLRRSAVWTQMRAKIDKLRAQRDR